METLRGHTRAEHDKLISIHDRTALMLSTDDATGLYKAKWERHGRLERKGATGDVSLTRTKDCTIMVAAAAGSGRWR